jgi:hypothetical protein
VYEWATKVKSVQEVLPTLLMQPDLAKTCSRIPTSISDDVCFLLDTNKLASQQDWKCDDMGSWKNNGVQRHVLPTPRNDEEPFIQNALDDSVQHAVKRIYFKNKSCPDLKKYVSFLEGKKKEFLLL